MVRLPRSAAAALVILALGATGASANCARGKMDPENAIVSCTEIIEAADTTDGARAVAYFNRASANRALGNNSAALGDFTSAIEITPEDSRLYNNRGRLEKTLGDYDAALADAEAAVRLEPDKPLPYMLRGAIHAALGDADAAEADWTKGFGIGGAGLVHMFQQYHKARGHFDGDVDGEDSPDLRKAMTACAKEPEC